MANEQTEHNENKRQLNFIEERIEKDLAEGRNDKRVHTRFPPEPNGYLHIGHAKSICLNFGLAREYNGLCNLRFDDTNPEKEEVEYVDSIKRDVQWLGFQWNDKPYFASDYFDQLYEWAVQLIKEGKAYVCDLPAEEFAQKYRGVPTRPGKESPYRSRTVEENLDLFERMKNGEFPNGSKVLRAKIDMTSPNMHMRDPALYRIKHAHHHRTGDKWCIYPTYDFAHGQSDYIEGITHSICTLEFEVHRPLYDWLVTQIATGGYRPQQIEFARLNMSYTVMSKRKLLQLVKENYVTGWDDPRMPTISGLRRRGFTPASIRNFAERVGVAKRDNVIDLSLLEYSVREDLNQHAQRAMAVLDPLKVVITNYPDNHEDELNAVNNPEDESMGHRKVLFTKELYIERADFMENPPKKFFRLAPGREVRLRYAFFITCNEVVKDENGNITELRCTYDPESRGGKSPDGRKVKGTLHWVSAKYAIDAEIRLYDRLFTDEAPTAHKDKDFKEFLNPDSLKILSNCKLEPFLKDAPVQNRYQFERQGYFCVDENSTPGSPVFNRIVPLRDSWAKVSKKKKKKKK